MRTILRRWLAGGRERLKLRRPIGVLIRKDRYCGRDECKALYYVEKWKECRVGGVMLMSSAVDRCIIALTKLNNVPHGTDRSAGGGTRIVLLDGCRDGAIFGNWLINNERKAAQCAVSLGMINGGRYVHFISSRRTVFANVYSVRRDTIKMGSIAK